MAEIRPGPRQVGRLPREDHAVLELETVPTRELREIAGGRRRVGVTLAMLARGLLPLAGQHALRELEDAAAQEQKKKYAF